MRNLKYGMHGEDVLKLKQQLVTLGLLLKCTHDRFLADTRRAVIRLQQLHGLTADGIVGEKTRVILAAALVEAEGSVTGDAEGETAKVSAEVTQPEHLKGTVGDAIALALESTSKLRRRIVMRALSFAVLPGDTGDLRCFYIRGANLYDKDLTLHEMTAVRLKSYFKRTAYQSYFDGGRQEMMEGMAERSGYAVPGCDCSGMVVGLWRAEGLVKGSFDACADSLFSRYCTETDTPQPGDLCWRKGHIGLYAGGGYAVECIGGAYGMQVTKITARRARNHVDGKLHSFSAWSGFGVPKCYGGR